MLKVRCFYNEPKGKTWKHFQEMVSRLDQKYEVEIAVTSQTREEYNSVEYAKLNLPVAPAIRIDDETVVEIKTIRWVSLPGESFSRGI